MSLSTIENVSTLSARDQFEGAFTEYYSLLAAHCSQGSSDAARMNRIRHLAAMTGRDLKTDQAAASEIVNFIKVCGGNLPAADPTDEQIAELRTKASEASTARKRAQCDFEVLEYTFQRQRANGIGGNRSDELNRLTEAKAGVGKAKQLFAQAEQALTRALATIRVRPFIVSNPALAAALGVVAEQAPKAKRK